MRKLVKLISIIIALILIIAGRFYYSVYASEYRCKIANKNDDINEKQKEFKIGTYNIKSLNYSKDFLDDFNNDIKELNLDIICLQEVDKNALRSGNFDMLKEIAKTNEFPYYHFYSTMWILDGYYGLGIMSKYPIIEVSSQLLPNSLVKEPRILTKTKISIGNKEIDVYNTHLTYENNDYRIAQMDYLKEQINFNQYSILAGDFNSFDINKNFQIENIESVNNDKNYMTFYNFAAPDEIFYSNHFVLKERGLKESSFSDHNLLYAQFRFN